MTTIDKAALDAARERLEAAACEGATSSSLKFLPSVQWIDLRLVLDALREAERKLAQWPSLMCPCCGDEAAFALYFEDGQPTICGCGGTVMADGNASVYIATDDGICENHKRAALRGEEAPRE